MMTKGFSITYETITPESAEDGEAADMGFVYEDLGFREAFQRIDYAGGYSNCEASEYPVRSPRWLTFYSIEEDFSTGEVTNWSLHIPDHVTPASRVRIARLFRCYGVK